MKNFSIILVFLAVNCMAQELDWTGPEYFYWPRETLIVPEAKLYKAIENDDIIVFEYSPRSDLGQFALVDFYTDSCIYIQPTLDTMRRLEEIVVIPYNNDSIFVFLYEYGLQTVIHIRNGEIAFTDTIGEFNFYVLYNILFTFENKIIGFHGRSLSSPNLWRFEYEPGISIINQFDNLAIPSGIYDNDIYPLATSENESLFILAVQRYETTTVKKIYKIPPYPNHLISAEEICELPRYTEYFNPPMLIYMDLDPYPLISYIYRTSYDSQYYMSIDCFIDTVLYSYPVDSGVGVVYWGWANSNNDNPYVFWKPFPLSYSSKLQYGQIVGNSFIDYGLVDPYIISSQNEPITVTESGDRIYLSFKDDSGAVLYTANRFNSIEDITSEEATPTTVFSIGRNEVIIEFNNISGEKNIIIYNIIGTVILSKNTTERSFIWRVTAIPTGLYFVAIRQNGVIIDNKKLAIIR